MRRMLRTAREHGMQTHRHTDTQTHRHTEVGDASRRNTRSTSMEQKIVTITSKLSSDCHSSRVSTVWCRVEWDSSIRRFEHIHCYQSEVVIGESDLTVNTKHQNERLEREGATPRHAPTVPGHDLSVGFGEPHEALEEAHSGSALGPVLALPLDLIVPH